MQPKFHVTATTAEDLRAELVEWLEHEATKGRAEATMSRTKRDMMLGHRTESDFRRAASFWSAVVIDPKQQQLQ